MFNYKQIYSACLVLIIFISGCGTWENFTTYFNVYYNAKLHYDEAMEDISKTEKDIFEFKEKPVSSVADKAFTKVIEKCSAILQYNPESAYFDDALFIIGVAYYYKQNYAKALRKFRELETVPETELALENKLWIGKTELQLRNFEEGIKQLEEVKKIAAEEEEEEILEQAYKTQIAFHFFQESYENAVIIINDFLNISENDETKAEVAFQLGKIYTELNDLNKAVEAYATVVNYSPSIRTEFQSKLELAKTNLQLQNYDQSIEVLQELRAEDKFSQYLDLIVYQTGVVYLEQEKLNEAIENFAVVDTMKLPSEKETLGRARIKLGELWEYKFMDFDSAAKYYNKAASSILLVEEKSYAISKTTLFRNYKRLSENIFKNERQLVYIQDRQEFVKDSIDYQDYLFELKQDSTRNIVTNPDGTQTARDNNRARDLQTGAVQVETQRTKPEFPKISADSLKTIVSKDKYDLGNMFFIELEVPDSAYYYYKDVLDNYPKRPFTPNVVYALGSYYLSVDDSLHADSVFQFIYNEYQGLPVADQAARRLGILEFDVETDSSAQFYIEAEKNLTEENYPEAIQNFYALADKFPESVLAPKALYSVGWVWENKLGHLDSAAIIYDTLVARYDKSLYAKDVFAKLQNYKQEMLRKHIEDSVAKKKEELEDVKIPEVKNTEGDIEIIKNDSLKINNKNVIDEIEDEPKTPENLRRKEFLEAEKERLQPDSLSKSKIDTLKEIEEPDTSVKADTLKPKTRTLLK